MKSFTCLRSLIGFSLAIFSIQEVAGHSYELPKWQVDDRCFARRLNLKEKEETQIELFLNQSFSHTFERDQKQQQQQQNSSILVRKNLRNQLQPSTTIKSTVNNNVTKEDEFLLPEERLLIRRLDRVLGPFHLKLYWEPWYCWQEEMIERKWCMECEGQTCEYGDRLLVQFCDECDVAQRFEYVPSGSYAGGQIRVATDNGDYGVDMSNGRLCWTRFSGRAHQLEECRDGDKNQIFNGFLEDAEQRFTIVPQYDATRCMTQSHHPKPLENIFAEDCIVAANTRWWQRYWEEDDDGNYINGNHQDQDLGISNSINRPPLTIPPSKNTNEVCGALRIRDWDCQVADMCNKCEGDCDSDADCKGNLRCHQNDAANPPPGCTGAPQWGRDYCYDPKDRSNELDLRSHSQCTILYPCDACQGDCDNDDECHGNLVCKQRIANEPVPGCTGSARFGRDYCIDPAHMNRNVPSSRTAKTHQPTFQPSMPPQETPDERQLPTYKPTYEPTPMPTLYPTLPPTKSPTRFPTKLPTILPTTSPTMSPTTSPTISRTKIALILQQTAELKSLVYINPECSVNNPCNECEGDCDSNNECAGDLICFQRNEYTPVPGCSGSGLQNKDYCIRSIQTDDSMQNKILVTRDVDCTSNQKCGKCEGDCDNDDECWGFLTCFQRNENENVPGCTGGGIARKDYCVDPMDIPKPPLIQVNRRIGHCSESNPCNICEGDCDSDQECAPGLACFVRAGIAPVPGCSGEGISGKDYCYDPSVYT